MKRVQEIIDQVLAIDPAAPAVEFEEVWMSWGAIDGARRQILDLLTELPGDLRIGIMMSNRPESIAAILSCISKSSCIVTFNPVYPDEKIAGEITRVATPVLIASARDWCRPAIAAAADALGAIQIEIAAAPDMAVTLRSGSFPGLEAFSHPTAPGVAVEMLTSGTTGPPKRIPMTAATFETAILSALKFESARSDDEAPRLRGGVQFLTAPIAHISGLLALLNVMTAGRKCCLMERFSVRLFLSAIRRHRPKVVSTPPAALRMIIDTAPPRDDLSSLVAWRTGTAPLDPALADQVFETYGIPVLQNYGATEFGGVAGWTIDDFRRFRKQKRGAVGTLNPGIEARTIDPETSEPLATGTEGVLQLRGQQIADGKNWLTTTDLAVVDEDRFLFIRGRADNAIIRGGFKIQPDDIVSALQSHPAILEAAVAALPDERLGQVPVAAYTLRENAEDPGSNELTDFLRQKLLPYQVPVEVFCANELPRTISMKVSQAELADMAKRLIENKCSGRRPD